MLRNRRRKKRLNLPLIAQMTVLPRKIDNAVIIC